MAGNATTASLEGICLKANGDFNRLPKYEGGKKEMLKVFKKYGRTALAVALAAALTLSSYSGVTAKEAKTQPTSYRTITEIQDWGPATTKVIVDLGRPVPVDSVTNDTFKVNVVRTEKRPSTLLLGPAEGDRKVTKAYVSDEKGNPAVATGKYAVLEMEIGPAL